MTVHRRFIHLNIFKIPPTNKCVFQVQPQLRSYFTTRDPGILKHPMYGIIWNAPSSLLISTQNPSNLPQASADQWQGFRKVRLGLSDLSSDITTAISSDRDIDSTIIERLKINFRVKISDANPFLDDAQDPGAANAISEFICQFIAFGTFSIIPHVSTLLMHASGSAEFQIAMGIVSSLRRSYFSCLTPSHSSRKNFLRHVQF
jgi:hypothetical protein